MCLRKIIMQSMLPLLLLLGCGVENHGINNTPATSSVAELSKKAPGFFIYRGGDSSFADGAVNIYVDQHYFATLLPATYRFIQLCPGKHTLSLALSGQDPAYRAKSMAQYSFVIEPKAINYQKVMLDQSGYLRVDTGSVQDVNVLLPTLQLSKHTISRLLPGINCH